MLGQCGVLTAARTRQCRTERAEQRGILEVKSEALGSCWNMQDEKKEASCLFHWFWSGRTEVGVAESEHTRKELLLRREEGLRTGRAAMTAL